MKTAPRMLTMALLVAAAYMATAAFAAAQTSAASALHPPKGFKVAIEVFEDLECPQCARIEPLLEDAARNYKVPLVRYDFPIPGHPWSLEAHIAARFFDTKSKALGEEFRSWIFANQPMITRLNIRAMIDRFASDHHVAMPTFLDSNGELAAKVKADFDFGEKIGIEHTPTVFVVSTSRSNPVVEVPDISKLFNVIEQVKTQVAAETPPPASRPVRGASGKAAAQ
ncbi:MAG: thioredoxin domain-containing protein [Candidatus Korobacteraceae bacterium]